MKKASINKKFFPFGKLELTCCFYKGEDKKMTTQDSEKTEKPVVEKPNADRPAPVEKPASTPEPNQGQERSEKDAKWQKEQTEAAKADAERKKLQGY